MEHTWLPGDFATRKTCCVLPNRVGHGVLIDVTPVVIATVEAIDVAALASNEVPVTLEAIGAFTVQVL